MRKAWDKNYGERGMVYEAMSSFGEMMIFFVQISHFAQGYGEEWLGVTCHDFGGRLEV